MYFLPVQGNIFIETLVECVCEGNPQKAFEVMASGTAEPFSYYWIGPNGYVSTNIEPTDIELAGVYKLFVTNAFQCTFEYQIEVPACEGPTFEFDITPPSPCNGDDGTLELTISGDNGPYTTTWFDDSGEVGTGEILEEVAVGNYYAEVTDAESCVFTTEIQEMIEGEPLSIVAVDVSSSCSMGNNGSISLASSGGLPPYSYLWSNGAMGASIENLSGGSYDVTITDAQGCTFQNTYVVNEYPGISISIDYNNAASCPEAADGSIGITATGGTPPYTYLWSNGMDTEDINGLSAGMYEVTVTDANACSTSGIATLNAGNGPTISFSQITNVSCAAGMPDGAVSLLVHGGTLPYQINWFSPDHPSFSSSVASIYNLAAGTYCISIVDDIGCEATNCWDVELDANVVTELPYLSYVEVSVNNIPIYQAEWIEESPGCMAYKKEESIGITDEAFDAIAQNGFIEVVAHSNVPLNNTTSLQFSGTNLQANGTPDNGGLQWEFKYTTGDNTSQLITDGIINSTLIFVGEDNYGNELLDLNTMSSTLSECATLPQLQDDCSWQPEIITGDDVVHHLEKICFDEEGIIVQSTDVSSPGSCDGAVTVFIPSSATPYEISYDGAAGQSSFTGSSSPYTLEGLCAGMYTLTVMDQNGCERTGHASIGVCQGFLVEPIITNVSDCNAEDGVIDIPIEVITGGIPPYSYSWNNGATTSTIESLEQGMYILTVTDAEGCEEIIEPVVSVEGAQNGSYDFQVSVASISHQDGGSCNASVTFDIYYTGTENVVLTIVSGPMGQGIETFTVGSGPIDETFVIDGLCTGIYQIEAVTFEGFSDYCTIGITVEIESCPGFIVQSPPNIIKPSGCEENDGSIQMSVDNLTGGVAPYIWSWSNGANSQSGLTDLEPGIYALTIVDVNGCMLEVSYDLSLPDDAGSYEIVSVTPDNGHCNGEITISGTPGISLTLSGVSTVIIPPEGVYTFTNLCTGGYNLFIADDAGCNYVEKITVPACSIIPPTFNLTAPTSCTTVDGWISWVPNTSGGTPPYVFSLFAENGSSIPQNNSGFGPLAEGSYTLYINDAAHCVYVETFNLMSEQTPQIALQDIMDECEGEANGHIGLAMILPEPVVGADEFIYHFTNNQTGAEQTIISSQSVMYFENLVTGYYTIMIENTYTACTTEETFFIDEIPSRGPFTLEDFSTTRSCPFQPTGTASFFISGGTPPYTVLMKKLDAQGDEEFENYYGYTGYDPPQIAEVVVDELAAGNYVIKYIKDDCDRQIPMENFPEVSIQAFPEMNIQGDIEVCCPGLSKIDLDVTGGTPAYTYSWSNGAMTEKVEELDAGVYTVTVTDAEGCYQDKPFDVQVIGAPNIVTNTIIGEACNHYSDIQGGAQVGNIGTLEINYINGGLPLSNSNNEEGCSFNYNVYPNYDGYAITWSTGAETPVISGLSTGWYTVSVTDGCGTHEKDLQITDGVLTKDPYPQNTSNEPTCWSIVKCGGYDIDVEYEGYQIDNTALNNGEGCFVYIDCNNGNLIQVDGLERNEDWQGGTASNGDCTICHQLFDCDIYTTYIDDIGQVEIDDYSNGTPPTTYYIYPPSEEVFIDQSGVTVYDRPDQLSSTNEGPGDGDDPCFSNQDHLLFDCGTDFDFCDDCITKDMDDDGIHDDLDNCPNTPNFDQIENEVDSNGNATPDGIGDACDNCPYHVNPQQEDILETTPPQPHVADENGADGVGDACDNCPYVFNPWVRDDNGNLVLDAQGNPIQADVDGDGVGDACDECPNVTSDADCAMSSFDPQTGCCSSALTGDEPNRSTYVYDQGEILKASISPNPISRDQALNLKLDCPFEIAALHIETYDAFGRQVFYKLLAELPKGRSAYKLQLPSELPSGIYTLQLKETNNQFAIFKILKL